MKQVVDNVQDGCPSLAFKVSEHVQCSSGDMLVWDTVLKRYGGNEEIRSEGNTEA